MLLQIFFTIIIGSASAQKTVYHPKGACDKKIKHTYYAICYSQEHRQAQWTYHKSTLANINGNQKRTDDFRRDPKLKDPVGAKDFSGSGYDRGHLVPAADMKLNKKAMSETFYMSNMSPQHPSMNRGIWGSLERKLRSWVRQDGEAYIITAPVLEDNLPTIKSGVSIPEFYYKIIYFPKKQIMKAFLISNEKHYHKNFYDYSVSVDEIEFITGLDFFSELPDDLEEELESVNYYD